MTTRIKSTYKPFEKDQLVWLEAKNLRLGYNKKISTKREPIDYNSLLHGKYMMFSMPLSSLPTLKLTFMAHHSLNRLGHDMGL